MGKKKNLKVKKGGKVEPSDWIAMKLLHLLWDTHQVVDHLD